MTIPGIIQPLGKQIALALRAGALGAELVKDIGQFLAEAIRLADAVPAVWHPLGFVQLPLWSGLNGEVARLHFWPVGQRRTQRPSWAIHRHAWNLKSHVLCGELTNTLYNGDPPVPVASHRVYAVTFRESRSVMTPTGALVNCRRMLRSTYRAGEEYEVPVEHFHESSVDPEQFTMTAVVTSQIKRVPPEVLVTLDSDVSYEYAREACEPGILEECLLLAGRQLSR